MGIEAATFVADFVAANPGSSDLRSQGDDHLRLIKAVLQATFPTASKAFYNPTAQAKTIDFAVVAADMNKTFLVDTTAGIVNMTLPTLVAGDAGWECFMLKTNTGTNTVLIKPPSGTLTSGAIAGLTAARRCIPGARISCLWTGTAWIIARAPSAGGPIGSAHELHVATLPVGYEWPNGQTLASVATNYPEFNSVNGSGVTLDKRGRIGIPLDNLGGSAAGRLAGGIITGTAVGNTGGTDTKTLTSPNLPAYTPSGTVTNGALTVNDATNLRNKAGDNNNGGGGGGAFAAMASGAPSPAITVSQATSTFAGTAQGGTSTAFGILQPSIMVTQVLVVE